MRVITSDPLVLLINPRQQRRQGNEIPNLSDVLLDPCRLLPSATRLQGDVLTGDDLIYKPDGLGPFTATVEHFHPNGQPCAT